MSDGFTYNEAHDQPALTALFDLREAYGKASSFRKLVRELCRLLTAMGCDPSIPDTWQQNGSGGITSAAGVGG